MLINKVFKLIKRRRNAARLGIQFKRCADFHLPEKIWINGKWQALSLPDENGVKVAFIELILDDCYGCRKISSPVKTVLDIGANAGLFGMIARDAFPNAMIHAYEPNPRLERHLSIQAKSGNFEYFMNAVGIKNGKVSLDLNEDSVQTRSITDENGDIDQISLKQAIERLGGSVDFVKMDCEGAEWQLFQDKESWNRIRHLAMEYHLWPDHTLEEALAKLRELGFRIQSHIPMDGFGLVTAFRE